MRRMIGAGLVVAVAAAVAAVALAGGSGTAARATGRSGPSLIQRRLMSGVAASALQAEQKPGRVHAMRRVAAKAGATGQTGCPHNRGTNVRVNRDCQNLTDPDLQGRAQAQNETSIAQDPTHPASIVASSNDYRRGDGGCYTYHSSDNGRTWRDSTPPASFTRGDAFGGFDRQYWQGGGDTSVAWDTKGNAYLDCQLFNRGQPTNPDPDMSSGFFVFRSTGTKGASWNFPGRPVVEASDPTGSGAPFLDKPYMAIDDTVGSPYQDRIYVTWTLFAADGTSYIYAAHSADYGEHFSAPVLVSRNSSLCTDPLGVPTPKGACNTNQFSQPFTGPDGNLYVAWDNYNLTGVHPRGDDAAVTAIDNRGQVLLSRSTDGGRSFSAPVKVSDYYDLPDCQTYQHQDEGVACVPEKGPTSNSIFRAANYPVGGVDPRDPSKIVVTVASYINRDSNESNGCVPRGYNAETFQPRYRGVKNPGACNNDIVISRSGNGGKTFTGGSANVRTLPAIRGAAPHADQFWQWATFDPRGRFVVSFYDRGYGDDERTGFSDMTLAGSRDGTTYAQARITTASMPPASQFEGSFFGDYSGLAALNGAHPFWMDTRDPELFACRDTTGHVTLPPSVCTAAADNAAVANDENTYTRTMAVPEP